MHVHTQTHSPIHRTPTSVVLVWQCSVVVWDDLASISSEKYHLQMAGSSWMYPVLPWQCLSLAGNHSRRCTHPHTCTFSSACLRQTTRESQWITKTEDQRCDTVTYASWNTHSRASFSPSFNSRTTYKHVRNTHTHTPLPPTCNLDIGEVIFYLSVTATGQAWIPTHTDTHTHNVHSFSISSTLYLLPPSHYDISGPPVPYTHILT